MVNGPRRLSRSSTDKQIFGVCGGLAEYFSIDPTLVRLLAAVALVLSGGMFGLAYLVGRFIIPWDYDVESG